MSGAAPVHRCLVTGASGFIGGSLARRLAGEGRAVRCLVRASSDTSKLLGLGVELAVGELADERSLEAAAEGCSHVVHCAALVSDWATVEEITAANVAGTRNVLRAAMKASVRRFVHVSTTDVYGHPGLRGVSETFTSTGFANWYAHTKLLAERELAGAGEMQTVALRPATVYGPGSRDVIGEIAAAIAGRHMLLVDGGRALAGLCYVENLADAAVLALEHQAAAGKAFNVTDGVEVTWRRLVDDLADGLDSPHPWLSVPYRPASVMGMALESAYRALRGATGVRTPPLLSRQAVQVLGVDQDFSNAKARRVLGWEPRVGYGEGLSATLEWLRDEHLARP